MRVTNLKNPGEGEKALLIALWKQKECSHYVVNGRMKQEIKISGLHTRLDVDGIVKAISNGKPQFNSRDPATARIGEGKDNSYKLSMFRKNHTSNTVSQGTFKERLINYLGGNTFQFIRSDNVTPHRMGMMGKRTYHCELEEVQYHIKNGLLEPKMKTDKTVNGSKRRMRLSLNYGSWTHDEKEFMEILWRKDIHWVGHTKFPTVVLTNNLITGEEIIGLIRKELGQAFVELPKNAKGEVVIDVHESFECEMRKEAKTFAKFSTNGTRNVQYDKYCDVWRVSHKAAKYLNCNTGYNTNSFKLKKFTFRLDYDAPAIELCVPHWFTQERVIQLGVFDDKGKYTNKWKAENSREMQLVKKLLMTEGTSCYLEKKADETMFKTLCRTLHLDENRGAALIGKESVLRLQ